MRGLKKDNLNQNNNKIVPYLIVEEGKDLFGQAGGQSAGVARVKGLQELARHITFL